jgi:hypothetical protein
MEHLQHWLTVFWFIPALSFFAGVVFALLTIRSSQKNS